MFRPTNIIIVHYQHAHRKSETPLPGLANAWYHGLRLHDATCGDSAAALGMASRFLRAELRPTSVTTLHPRRTASLLTAVGADIGTRSLLSAASFTPGNSVGVLDAPSAWQLSPHGQLHWHQYRAPATAGDCLVSLRTPPFEVGRLGTWKQPSMTSAGMFCGGCWGGLLVRPNRHLSSGRSTEPKRWVAVIAQSPLA